MNKTKFKKLKKLLALSDIECADYLAKNYNWSENINNELFFKDNGSKVLVVAHIDTVFKEKQLVKTVNLENDTIIFSTHCDDRIGVFACLELLNELDIDILLTTGEEICQSTASLFDCISTHEYNWIVEFDRAGDDIVLYEYEYCHELVTDLEYCGFMIGIGSYSDICELEYLKRGAFNVGIGYYFQHTEKCFTSIKTLENQIDKFIEFYYQNYDKEYIYDPFDFDYSISIDDNNDFSFFDYFDRRKNLRLANI